NPTSGSPPLSELDPWGKSGLKDKPQAVAIKPVAKIPSSLVTMVSLAQTVPVKPTLNVRRFAIFGRLRVAQWHTRDLRIRKSQGNFLSRKVLAASKRRKVE